MGTENSKFLNQQQLPTEYKPLWELPRVYESIINGTKIQKHKLRLTSEAEINYEKEVFIFRRMNADRVITANYFENFEPKNMCSVTYEVCFFTEYPAYSMSLDLIMSSDKSFNLLIECLKGFELLYQKFGPFHVGFQNIFFDSHHQPKVWISSDLGKTSIDTNFGYETTEQIMILNLFSLFDQLRDNRNMSTPFSNYLKKLQTKSPEKLTFVKVIEFMVEEASKYFVSRVDDHHNRNLLNSGESQVLKRHLKNVSSIKSKMESPHRRESDFNSHVISLKNRSKNNSKCEKNPNQMSPIDNVCQIGASTVHKFRNGNDGQLRRTRRYNSQEDCSYIRENMAFETPPSNKKFSNKENFRVEVKVEEGFKQHIKNSLVFTKTHAHRELNGQKFFRNSMEEFENPTNFLYDMKNVKANQMTMASSGHKTSSHEINASKAIFEKEGHKHYEEEKQTQKTINFCYSMPNEPIQKQKKTRFNPKVYCVASVPTESENYKPETLPVKMWKDPMVLKKLQTLKSIVQSEISDMDDQIRNDLENYRI